MILIASAAVFLLVLFFIKNGLPFQKKSPEESDGLTYSTALIGDLVGKDTDGDGIVDWEESLYGTDPTKAETTPGTPDAEAVEKLKAAQAESAGTADAGGADEENLTETDKFSRDLFATVAATTQSGSLDDATADQIGSSLADHIQNSAPRKVYAASDLKISAHDTFQATKDYADAVTAIQTKYPISPTVIDVLQQFMPDENTIHVEALTQLSPIETQTNNIIAALLKTSVPQSVAPLHLNFINDLERLSENVHDIALYDTDPILAMSAISQYDKNTETLQTDLTSLGEALNQKLNN